MLQNILKTSMEEFPMDATDALAAAVCHHFSGGKVAVSTDAKGKKTSGWAAFLKQNPERRA